jgi:hypothetical protein
MACFPAVRVRGNQWSPNGSSHEGDELEGSTRGAVPAFLSTHTHVCER